MMNFTSEEKLLVKEVLLKLDLSFFMYDFKGFEELYFSIKTVSGTRVPFKCEYVGKESLCYSLKATKLDAVGNLTDNVFEYNFKYNNNDSLIDNKIFSVTRVTDLKHFMQLKETDNTKFRLYFVSDNEMNYVLPNNEDPSVFKFDLVKRNGDLITFGYDSKFNFVTKIGVNNRFDTTTKSFLAGLRIYDLAYDTSDTFIYRHTHRTMLRSMIHLSEALPQYKSISTGFRTLSSLSTKLNKIMIAVSMLNKKLSMEAFNFYNIFSKYDNHTEVLADIDITDEEVNRTLKLSERFETFNQLLSKKVFQFSTSYMNLSYEFDITAFSMLFVHYDFIKDLSKMDVSNKIKSALIRVLNNRYDKNYRDKCIEKTKFALKFIDKSFLYYMEYNDDCIGYVDLKDFIIDYSEYIYLAEKIYSKRLRYNPFPENVKLEIVKLGNTI